MTNETCENEKIDVKEILHNRNIDDVNDKMTEMLSMAVTENGNADSKVGWSSAFFALFLTILITIGFSISTPWIWYVIGPILALPATSTLILLIALNPHPKETKVLQSLDFDSLVETEMADLLDASVDRRIEIIEGKKMYALSLYASVNRKIRLVKIAYLITFPFLILFYKFA